MPIWRSVSPLYHSPWYQSLHPMQGGGPHCPHFTYTPFPTSHRSSLVKPGGKPPTALQPIPDQSTPRSKSHSIAAPSPKQKVPTLLCLLLRPPALSGQQMPVPTPELHGDSQGSSHLGVMLVSSLCNRTPAFWVGQVCTSEPTASGPCPPSTPGSPSWSRLPPKHLSELLLVCDPSARRTQGILSTPRTTQHLRGVDRCY